MPKNIERSEKSKRRMVQSAKRLVESPSHSTSASAITSPPLAVQTDPPRISATPSETTSKRNSFSGEIPVRFRDSQVNPLDTALAASRYSPSSEISENENPPDLVPVRGRIQKRVRRG